MKSHSLFIGALAMAGLAIPATASAQSGYGYTYNPPVQNVQCERQRKDDQFAGVGSRGDAGRRVPRAIGRDHRTRLRELREHSHARQGRAV